MAGFFSKIFGGGKKSDLDSLIETTLTGILEHGGFDLSYNLDIEKGAESTEVKIDFSGPDEELLKEQKGQLLDAFQLILKRVAQHNFSETVVNINVDCGGFRSDSEAALIERAEHLKTMALEQGKSVYYRALPPRERKVVHQYLALDTRIKSRSLGDGLYKKIKIFPIKNQDTEKNETNIDEA